MNLRPLNICTHHFFCAAALWLLHAEISRAQVPSTITAHRHHVAARSYGGYHTADRISNARANCDRYPWARTLRNHAVENAAYWVNLSDESLWSMVPGQDLPRCIDVTFDRLTTGPRSLGCLQCGNEIRRFGNYPYEPDFLNKPWKLTCPSCHAVFPTNDFGKYYASAIDEHGVFNPAKGDTSLLFNEAHPDPKDPLHKFGVDNGFGYVDKNGREHRYIGYYTWKYWTHLNDGLAALADAFLYTGETRYAHKAAILLDRIADVYPDMDWKPYAERGWYHSDGGTYLGKIEGCIWETGVVQKFAESYDKIISGTLDDSLLFDFLRRQAERYDLPTPKGTRELFLANVDERILNTAFEAVHSGQIRGNQGMHQLTVAMCAIALNTEPTTSEWLQWLFEPYGGAIPGLMMSQFDRDGTSDEGAPSYAMIWGRLITRLASWIANYPAYTRNDIFRDYPQFRATFLSAYRMAALGVAIPNIGDSGATGLVTSSLIDPRFIALGYYYTRDPELAVAAYRANGNRSDGLGLDVFSADPEALSREIETLGKQAGPRSDAGHLMTGFGLALLETGAGSHGVAVAASYGRTTKHAHPDLLNFDLFAFEHWLAPDHGYPEFATRWPSNGEWTGSTLSHNTVFVDGKPQKEIWGGYVRIFKQLKGFGMVRLDGRNAYPGLREYTRTLYLIGGEEGDMNSPAYLVDVFQVKGGRDHVYSFHGPPGVINHELRMTAQRAGTYAGNDVPKGAWADGFPIGYSHLYNVRRDRTPPPAFVLDWKADQGYRGLQGDVHLRLHVLNQYDEVSLAEGDPPQNKPGNPERLGYALMRRTGSNLNSTFVSVIEPYKGAAGIRSIRRLDDLQGDGVALEIQRANGTTDYVFHQGTSNETIAPLKNVAFDGAAAWVRERKGAVNRAVLVGGDELRFKRLRVTSTGAYEGKVIAMNRELQGGGWLVVDKKLPADGSLSGEHIMIHPSGERDATYTIRRIEERGPHSWIYCGPISFVRGYRGEEVVVRGAHVPKDYDQGFLYDFEEGASFRITNHAEWRAGEKSSTDNRKR